MTKLTPKQSAFVHAYIETGSASEAYRRAYASGSMKPTTINRKAVEVLANPKIAATVQGMQAKAAETAQYTLADHLKRLDDLSKAAEAAQKFEAAVKAEENRGKAAGFYKDRVELTGKDGAPVAHTSVTAEQLADAVRNVQAKF